MRIVMKKTIFILLASFLVLACSDEVTEIYEENHGIQFEITSSRVVFSSDGGFKTVLVTSSMDWDCHTDASWFTVTKGEGQFEIAADANNSGAARYGEITVVASSGEVSYAETVSVAQRVSDDDSTDLSVDETANCYIAGTETNYRFDATVKGNGLNTEGAAESYIGKYGATIAPSEIVYADLLWEAAFDADKTRSCNIIDGTPVYSDGYVYFTTGSAEGNAVIAVKNAVGTVLWSWHIWVTDSEIAEIEGNGFYWMDRNLGALTTAEEDVNNRGLLYQWGRKDPFLPSSGAYGERSLNVKNTQVGKGSGEWDYDGYTTKLAEEAPGNISLSVENPMTMLLVNGSTYSWYITRANNDNYFNYLWGDSSDLSTYVKSMFDPCPAGYNVPVENPWLPSDDNQDVNVWSVDLTYGRNWIGGNNAFYPCAGAFNGSQGAHVDTSYAGYYWTSGLYSSSSYFVMSLFFTPATAMSYSYSYPVHAMYVRCMRVD